MKIRRNASLNPLINVSNINPKLLFHNNTSMKDKLCIREDFIEIFYKLSSGGGRMGVVQRRR